MQSDTSVDMTGKVAVITGASGGIGLAAARELVRYGAEIVVLARHRARGEAAVGEIASQAPDARVSLVLCDLADFTSVRSAADAVLDRWPQVHVLCNNAGGIMPERSLTPDGCERTLQTNHFSHYLLTRRLEPALRAARARVITVSSDAHLAAFRGIPFSDITMEHRWAPFLAYAVSKLANIMFAYEYARRASEWGVLSNAMHPGLARTEFGRAGWGRVGSLFPMLAGPWYLTPHQAADTLVFLANSLQVEGVTGRYYYRRRPKRSSRVSYDAQAQRRLWDVSEQVVRDYL